MKTFYAPYPVPLKDFTDSVYPQGSFAFAALLRARDIKVNGARVGKNVMLSAGDEVVYYTNPKQEQKPSHSVIYADENILVADKYGGVSSEALLSELCGKGEYFAVHRLDRNTAGLILFAKTEAAERELLQAFRERKIVKTYLCFCKNRFRKKHDCLTAYLKKDGRAAEVKIYGEPTGGAVKIVTEYTVAESLGDYALVEIALHTGKTHQIRAHMAHIGCPVLGDEKYGDERLNEKYGVKRQCLVAKRLAFSFTGALSYLNGATFESAFWPQLPSKN